MVTAGCFRMLAAAGLSALAVVAVLSGCGGKDTPKTPAVDALSYGTHQDTRDGKVYRTIKIGTQTWFAENLNYNAKGSVCYDNKPEKCETYGRLYDWNTAMKACPAGWHLPSDSEWDVLMVAVGGVRDNDGDWQGSGKKLRSASGWNEGGNGTDNYGVSALPGGYGYSDGLFDNAGLSGYWWSATEYDASDAWIRRMDFNNEGVDRYYDSKAIQFSVRCVAE